MEISASQLIQLGGIIVSFAVVGHRMFELVRNWRGGSPELRLIRDQLKASNDDIRFFMRRIIDRLDSIR